jgi:hypothetical protein
MRDVSVPKVVLDRSCVVAIVRQFEPGGMAQHVGVDAKGKAGLHAESCDHPTKAADREWRSRGEHFRLPFA